MIITAFLTCNGTSIDHNEEYIAIIDAGSNIHPHERYHTQHIKGEMLQQSATGFQSGSVGDLLVQMDQKLDGLNTLVNTLLDYSANRTRIDPNNFTLTIYADDGVTPIRIFSLVDENGNPSITNIFERIPQ